MNKIILSILAMMPLLSFGQTYTSYFTGNETDVVTNPLGGVCIMGGASEDDNAMQWFLEKANGGDVLVLRATGSDGYNSYLFSELGVAVNSVETIVCSSADASNDPYVLQKINQAEAIWFAGGDQWTYISYWRDTPVSLAINDAIQNRNIVIGGTSAGMAIQGEYYFSAENGTVTSAAALANPFNNRVTVGASPFITNEFLEQTITDTHFDNPDRKGRLATFLARIYTDHGVYAKAIACDEYTAVCIETDGMARVYGGAPTYDDNAYFIQSNCELIEQAPEICASGIPLTWDLDGLALKVYQIKGDETGNNTFDLNTWQSGSGGSWHNWSVLDGVFSEQTSTPVNCLPQSVNALAADLGIDIFPNPSNTEITITSSIYFNKIEVFNTLGQMEDRIDFLNTMNYSFTLPDASGAYLVRIFTKDGIINRRVVKN